MDWTHLIAVTLPVIFLWFMWYLLNLRVIDNEKTMLKLLEIISCQDARMDLIEANQKIFYELHKRNS